MSVPYFGYDICFIHYHNTPLTFNSQFTSIIFIYAIVYNYKNSDPESPRSGALLRSVVAMGSIVALSSILTDINIRSQKVLNKHNNELKRFQSGSIFIDWDKVSKEPSKTIISPLFDPWNVDDIYSDSIYGILNEQKSGIKLENLSRQQKTELADDIRGEFMKLSKETNDMVVSDRHKLVKYFRNVSTIIIPIVVALSVHILVSEERSSTNDTADITMKCMGLIITGMVISFMVPRISSIAKKNKLTAIPDPSKKEFVEKYIRKAEKKMELK